jgi:cell division FtsZ-interacting protein ZapD
MNTKTRIKKVLKLGFKLIRKASNFGKSTKKNGDHQEHNNTKNTITPKARQTLRTQQHQSTKNMVNIKSTSTSKAP